MSERECTCDQFDWYQREVQHLLCDACEDALEEYMERECGCCGAPMGIQGGKFCGCCLTHEDHLQDEAERQRRSISRALREDA